MVAKLINQSGDGLDRFDRAILKRIQTDNTLSHARIGEDVGLSPSAVRRRIAILRESGVIAKEVALLNRDMVGETFFVTVYFETDGVEIYKDFMERMRQHPEVGQCYHISGDGDFLLVVHTPTLRDYEAWGMEHLMDHPNIRRFDTVVSYSCAKFDTAVVLR